MTPSGEVSTLVSNLKEEDIRHDGVGDHHYVMGVWTDAAKDIYVAVYGAQKVKKLSPNKELETVYQSSPNWSPCGGLVAPDGSLWIMELSVNAKVRVVQIKPNHEERIFLTPS